MRIAARIASICIIALGLVQIVTALGRYNLFSSHAVWFLGTGMAIVLAGVINIRFQDDHISERALAPNLLGLFCFAAASYITNELYAFVGFVLFGVIAIWSIMMLGKNKLRQLLW